MEGHYNVSISNMDTISAADGLLRSDNVRETFLVHKLMEWRTGAYNMAVHSVVF